jgi:hypothetical protein
MEFADFERALQVCNLALSVPRTFAHSSLPGREYQLNGLVASSAKLEMRLR